MNTTKILKANNLKLLQMIQDARDLDEAKSIAQFAELISDLKFNKFYLGKSKKCSGNVYRVSIKKDGKTISFNYHDNYKNDSNILYWLTGLSLDASSYINNKDNLLSFANEFGYNVDDPETQKIYNACKKQYQRYTRMFNHDERNIIDAFTSIF